MEIQPSVRLTPRRSVGAVYQVHTEDPARYSKGADDMRRESSYTDVRSRGDHERTTSDQSLGRPLRPRSPHAEPPATSAVRTNPPTWRLHKGRYIQPQEMAPGPVPSRRILEEVDQGVSSKPSSTSKVDARASEPAAQRHRTHRRRHCTAILLASR